MTLTNDNTVQKHGTVDYYPALVTIAGNDTTTNIDSNVITNLDGSIKDLSATLKVTNQTGTSPTAQLKFLGSHFPAGPFNVLQTAQGATAGTVSDADAVAALDISTASSTNVSQTISTSMFGLVHLPPYLKVRSVTGGSASPGLTGVIAASVKR